MRSINIYQDLADFVMYYVLGVPDIARLDFGLIDIDLLEPEGDELFRFEVVYDDGTGNEVLVVAEGEIDYDFTLNLRILEE